MGLTVRVHGTKAALARLSSRGTSVLGKTLSAFEEFVRGHSDVRSDLSEQDGGDVSPFMKRNGRSSTIFVTKPLVRTALPDLDESEVLEDAHYLSRFEDRQSGHLS